MAEVGQLPIRQCGCHGDGVTWVDVSGCAVHTVETSPLAQSVEAAWQEQVA